MLMGKGRILNYIKDYFSKGKSRSVEAKKNILFSIILKGIGMLFSFVSIPILLDLFSVENYGVWLTVSSIVTWFNFLDFGLANGFRNKFAEAIGLKNIKLAREYVSTIYFVLPAISILFLLVFIISSSFVNWNSVFNTKTISNETLEYLTIIIMSSFAAKFCIQPIGQILLADQKPALYNSFFLIANIISLGLSAIYGYGFGGRNILVLGSLLAYSQVIVLIIATLVLFRKKYNKYLPNIKMIKIDHLKPLFGLGINFFFIQISMVVIMYSTNFLIAQYSSPAEVSKYNIAQKLFSIGTMVFAIILTPMWSAITDAYINNDFEWIKKVMYKFRIIALYSSLVTLLLLVFSKFIFAIWLRKQIEIPFSYCLVEAIKTIVYMFFSPFASFLNGVSKIRLNVYLVIFQTICYIPLTYFLASYMHYGVVGIILAGLLVELPLRFTQPLQFKRILNKTASGVWNK